MASVTATQVPDKLPGSTFVEHKLHRAWKKERHFQHTRGLCYFVLWALAMVLLDLLVDFLFRVPGYWRMALLAVNGGALVWVLYHHWFRYLRHYDPVRTALQVEGRHPELQSLLVSFVQFREGPRVGAHVSPSLLNALRRQTIEYTQPIDFREIVNYRELKRIFLLSIAVVAFFGAVSVNWSEHLRVLFYRMLNPEARLGYPTATRIVDITGNATVQQGKKVGLVVRAVGLLPREGTLYVRPEAGAWEQTPFPKTHEDAYGYDFQEVYQTFHYRVRLGDAYSDEYTVQVVPPPRIVETRVHLTYPAYTGTRPRTLDILNLEVPEGTKLRWELRCDQPLASAAMLREEAAPTTMTLTVSGLVATTEAVATESFDYSFDWKEKHYGYEYKDEVRYFVQVIPDSAPQVEILRPLEDEKATVRKTLTITYQARDDYGLAEAWIVYSLNDGDEQKVPLGALKGRVVDSQEAPWVLKKTIPNLKEGDVVTYAIEVADNHTGEGGAFKSRSQGRRIYLVSIEEYLRYLAERRRKLVADIRTMHQQEHEAADKVGEIEFTKPE
ncbi:MAG TPA: DUF4175 family protein [Planctomycetota bacterium]|nr:DUF4175 family protein [Planctomycetota bacterium]